MHSIFLLYKSEYKLIEYYLRNNFHFKKFQRKKSSYLFYHSILNKKKTHPTYMNITVPNVIKIAIVLRHLMTNKR